MSKIIQQTPAPVEKKVLWVKPARKDIHEFPKAVREDMGAALREAALGGKSPRAKVLKGFGGASVLEVVSDFNTDTFRAVYTVKFARAIVVVHCFQKKSKHGNETDQVDKDLIKKRLKDAQEVYSRWLEEQEI